MKGVYKWMCFCTYRTAPHVSVRIFEVEGEYYWLIESYHMFIGFMRFTPAGEKHFSITNGMKVLVKEEYMSEYKNAEILLINEEQKNRILSLMPTQSQGSFICKVQLKN